jgi:hypothetical protein
MSIQGFENQDLIKRQVQTGLNLNASIDGFTCMLKYNLLQQLLEE